MGIARRALYVHCKLYFIHEVRMCTKQIDKAIKNSIDITGTHSFIHSHAHEYKTRTTTARRAA